jgi:hypothetical protein
LRSDLTQRTLSELAAICNPSGEEALARQPNLRSAAIRAPRGDDGDDLLQKIGELLHREPRLSNDRAHGAWFQVSSGMNRNGYRTSRVIGIDEHMVAADYSIDEKARSCESLNDTLTVDDGKLSATHN